MASARVHSNGRLLMLLLLLAVAGFAVAQQPDNPPQGYYYSTNFSPSMAIVIVVLIAAFFFLGFFSIYVRHCYSGRADYSTTPLPQTGAGRSRRQRGLDQAVLVTFPTMTYADVKAHKSVKGALECAVCISEFDDDETLRLLPKCSHVFHQDCIDTWLASHVTCPVCRANLAPNHDGSSEPASDVPAEIPTEGVPPSASAVDVAAPGEAPPVVIDVEETEEERIIREEAAELTRIGSLKRALRSKSGRAPARFPRSHSTGHSLSAAASAGAGAGSERFTLRLPEHVLREVIAAGHLQRTTSLVAFRAGRQGSTRRGLRAGGEGSNRAGRSVRLGQSGRWPSFLARTFSARLPAWGSRSTRRGEGDGSSKGGRTAGAGGRSVACDDQACALGQRV
ncbi:E3 ubiquitin-protein ligase ATL31-like [Oryza brachyantha]|uniref:RING-type E3 ubiquitin transferase n=1 Tax=Oryza brachyantha TaxID=4533 RepID=J3MYB6_ORYBR|nr:E3 ubiquitin-protein ligase ATL31-like [Oryza brachyantha]